MKRFLSILLALCLMTVFTAAYAEDITLSIIHEHTESNAAAVASSQYFLEAEKEFLEANPNIKMDTTALGSSTELWDKLAVLAASNDLPDIIYMSSTVFNTIAPEGMLVDLTGLADPAVYRDGLTTYSYDGKVYALPVKCTTYDYVFYNTEIWAEAGYETLPTTWDEFIEACDKLRAMGYTPVSCGNKTLWNIISNYLCTLVVETCGEEWIAHLQAHDGEAHYSDQCFLDALNMLQRISSIWNYDYSTADDQWAVGEYCKGNAAAHISGSWVPGSIVTYEGDYPGIIEKTRTAPVPTISGEAPTIASGMAQALGVNSKLEGEKLEAAKAYVLYLAGESYSKHMAAVGQMGPVIVDVDLSALYPMQQQMFEIMNSCKNIPQFTIGLTPSESTEIQSAVSSFLAGSITAEEAAASIQAVAP